MNFENCLFIGLTLIFASLFIGTIEFPVMIIAGAFTGKFLPIWLQIIITLFVVGFYRYKASETDTSLKDAYHFLILVFIISVVMGNSYYYFFDYLRGLTPALKNFLTTHYFKINLLR